MSPAGVLTISDRGSRGEREDASGPRACALLTESGISPSHTAVVPDDPDHIRELLIRWCDTEHLALIVTTGGTGVSPRDLTPEATLSVIKKRLPGMEEAMRAFSLTKTPHAMLSRAVCGIRGTTLIINLPGSPRAVEECLQVILPALPHALAKIAGDQSDCGHQAP